jgi:IS5 family transposase
LRGRTKRALDSTVLDDAVATQDTVTQLIAAIRRVLRVVPAATEVELVRDYSSPTKPDIAWDDPQAKDELITVLVNDALALLASLDGVDLDGEQSDAVGLLALVAGQDVEEGDQPGSWRIARRTAHNRIVSTVDPESRHVHKTVHDYRDGYKGHVAVEPETGIITATALTPGNTPDHKTGLELLATEAAPVEVLADSAYGAGELRAKLNARGHTATIKPLPIRPAVAGGFTVDDFAVDVEASAVTCPAGNTVRLTRKLNATFGALCTRCPLRSRCTNAKDGRKLALSTYDVELRAARHAVLEPEFQHTYRRWRPPVERSIAWLVANNNRRLRYRGIARNQQWLATRAAAINLRRLIALGLTRDTTGWAIA